MSDDQQNQQHNQPEPQHDGQVVLPPHADALFRVTDLTIWLTGLFLKHYVALRSPPVPYDTSSLSRAGWIHELLTGHPECIRNELGVYRSTFILLVKALQTLSLQSSCHVSIEEQLSIFLYTAVTGLSCTHVAEQFQQSTATITK